MIRVYEPIVAHNQLKYVYDAINKNELTFYGEYHHKFEKALKDYFKVKNVILTCNGTVSLYAAYHELFNSYPKCYIITPTLTFASTVSQIKLLGFTPLYIDCDENLQINMDQLEKAIKHPGVNGCVIAELYADSPDLNKIKQLCEENKIPLVEDSAEALGCTFDNKAIGTFGNIGSFSFFANKIITTCEGGCLITNDDILAEKLHDFCNCNTKGGYKYNGLGSNFRMTNIQAAVGLAQLEQINYIKYEKQQIASKYKNNLKFNMIKPKISDSSYWMPVFKLNKPVYENFRDYCAKNGIEVRPTFYPLHEMPEFDGNCPFPLTNAIESKNKYFILPCYVNLSVKDQDYIIDIVNKYEY